MIINTEKKEKEILKEKRKNELKELNDLLIDFSECNNLSSPYQSNVEVPLSDYEIDECKNLALQLDDEIDKLEEEKKQIASSYSTKIKSQKLEKFKIKQNIKDKAQEQEKTVINKFYNGKCFIVDFIDNTIYETRELTHGEKQKKIEFNNE